MYRIVFLLSNQKHRPFTQTIAKNHVPHSNQTQNTNKIPAVIGEVTRELCTQCALNGPKTPGWSGDALRTRRHTHTRGPRMQRGTSSTTTMRAERNKNTHETK